MIKRVSEINKKSKANDGNSCSCNSYPHYKLIENLEVNSFKLLPKSKDDSMLNENFDFKKLFIETDILNHTRKIYCQEDKDNLDLDKVLAKIQEFYGIKKEDLAKDLYGVCGDINSLVKYYDGCTGIKWYPDEDEVLRMAKDPMEINFQLLLKYKGNEEIDKRCTFLSVPNPLYT